MSKKIKIEKGKLTIIEEKELDMNDVKSKKEAKDQLQQELSLIIKQVKGLKVRAEEIKEILSHL